MTTRSRPVDRARQRIDDDLHRVLADLAAARNASGLSFDAVGEACGVDGSTAARTQTGITQTPNLRLLAEMGAVVGLEIRLRAYPAGDALRDAGQARLLERLRRRLHPSLEWRTEVGL